jgi:hypothetical protein
VSDNEFEPVPGLPESLPQGERILWQGSPEWIPLALRAFRLREVGAYFAALMAWRAGSALWEGALLADALSQAAALLPLAGAAGVILLVMGRVSARTTLYTITNKRVVMRYGMAVPLVMNIPFSKIEAAAHGDHGDGTGSIPLTLRKGERLGYLVLWPHARPWRYGRPEPMLRCLPDAAQAANILSAALRSHTGAATIAEGARPHRAPEASHVDAPDMALARTSA